MAAPLPICYLNGEYLPLAAARISPLDRGFLYGDGAYEVMPVYGGRPFRLEAHCARLTRSLGEIRMADPLERAQWCDLFAALIAPPAILIAIQRRKERKRPEWKPAPNPENQRTL